MPAASENVSAILQFDSSVSHGQDDAWFSTSGALEIDLGCGSGRFLLARAAAFPSVKLLGIDRMQKRIRKIDRMVTRMGIANIRLLHAEATEALRQFVPASSTSVLYVFFPDPWPKRRHHRRRVFSGEPVDAIHRILVPEGALHIATDHRDYFEFIVELFRTDSRFCAVPAIELPEEQKTDFELDFLNQGLPVWRCSFLKTGPRIDM